MPDFSYTYDSWDAIRPGALPSTGLGAALKKYETAKARFDRLPKIANYTAAVKELAEVEVVRAKAIKACKLYKDARRALEAADPDAERAGLNAALAEALAPVLKTTANSLKEYIASLPNRIEFANGLADAIRSGKATAEQRKQADRLANSESNAVLPGTSDLPDEFVELRKARARLESVIPDVYTAVNKISEKLLPQFMDLRKTYKEALNDLVEAVG